MMAPEPEPGIPLEGLLGDPSTLPRLLAWLARGEWSGALVVRAGDVERTIFLAEGRIQTATSSDPADALVDRMIAAGQLDAREVERAIEHLGTSRRDHSFGRQLVRLRQLDEETLRRAERARVIATCETTLALRTGEYRANPGLVAGDALPPQLLEVPRVVATALLTRWDDAWALAALGGERAVLDIVLERLPEYEATGAEEAYDLAFLRVNGKRSVRELVDMAPLPPHATLRFLAAARLIGCLEVVAQAEERRRPRPETERSGSAPRQGEERVAQSAATDASGTPMRRPGDSPARRPARPPRPAEPTKEAAGVSPWLVIVLVILVAAVIGWFVVVGLDEIGETPPRPAVEGAGP